MQVCDVERVHHISCECFSTPWSLDSISREIINPVAYYLVAEVDHMVVGYGGMWCVLNEAEIINIAVSKAYQRKKVGAMLLKQLMLQAKQQEVSTITLEVRQSNTAARKLYKSQGFVEIARRKSYYKLPTEDAIIMQCIL